MQSERQSSPRPAPWTGAGCYPLTTNFRSASGLIAEFLDWRAVFAMAAVAMVILAAVLRVTLPRVPPTERLSYPRLLRSTLALIRGEPLLRQRMLIGATAFGCFSVLWTSIAFLLDLGAQAMHISNQSAIYTLHGQARSRLTTAYRVAYFMGGVLLSAATSALYADGDWPAVCALGVGTAALGVGTAALGLVAWLVSEYAMTGRLPLSADTSS